MMHLHLLYYYHIVAIYFTARYDSINEIHRYSHIINSHISRLNLQSSVPIQYYMGTIITSNLGGK